MKKNHQGSESENQQPAGGLRRRDLLKGLASLPVFGLFAYEYLKKRAFDRAKKQDLLHELGLTQEAPAVLPKTTFKKSGELVRVGIIGFGIRGEQLARALGFAHPDWIESERKKLETHQSHALEIWLNQPDVNVAITGICDVFDLRAQRALEVVQNPIRPSGAPPLTKVRRFANFREMVTSKDVDAIMIATPDFHHAAMAIAAVNEGKHVFCEKCMTRTEEEVYEVEAAVKAAQKNKQVVFQVGHQYKQNQVYHMALEILQKKILGQVTLVETFTNRNTPDGAWVRHLDEHGRPKPGNEKTIDWQEWLGSAPPVPFSLERFYNWSKYWDYATGLSGQLFSHEYDTVNHLLDLGMPASCTASGGIYFYKDGREIPDIFHAVFEFPEKNLTLFYSASLASDRPRRSVYMGNDGWMEVGNLLNVYADDQSIRYKKKIEDKRIDPSRPIFTYLPGKRGFDVVTSASEKYYAERGLMYTMKEDRPMDVTHLHVSEWLDGIRNGSPLSCPIEKGVEATLACHMATKAYREKCVVYWDAVRRRIVCEKNT